MHFSLRGSPCQEIPVLAECHLLAHSALQYGLLLEGCCGAFPSLSTASVMSLLVCQGIPYMSGAWWIIRIIIRKVIRSPLSSIAVMRPLGHPRNEFNLPLLSPLDEPWRCRHDPSVLNTSTSLLKGLHKIFNLF